MTHDNLKERTFRFAVTSIRSAKPPIGDPVGRHLVGQVIRSGAGVASNYNAACHAKSRPDFASKVTVVAEEAAETVLWFRLFVELDLLAGPAVEPLIKEGQELASIAVASARTARRPQRDRV